MATNSETLCDIPSEFRDITLASTFFYKVSSPLEQIQGSEPVRKHVVIATSLGHLTELREGKVLRFTNLVWKDVKKIVVHHEFNPLVLYIVLLHGENSAAILSYSTLKILHEWEEVTDINSSDLEESGSPSLHLTTSTGQIKTISTVELSSLSHSGVEKLGDTERGKVGVAEALTNRLKDGIKHVELLHSQRRTKETFILRKLSTIQSQLQGDSVSESNHLMPVLMTKDESGKSSAQFSFSVETKTPPLKILSVRDKIIHDKWVIGLNVINNSDRMLVCNLQLKLQVTKGTNSLSYLTKIFKVVQRKVASASIETAVKPSNLHTKITIESLEPPLLRPKKKATVLGVCAIPNFTEGSIVVCSGLVTYTGKTLNPEATQDLVSERSSFQQYQLSFEPIEINVCDIHSMHIGIEKNTGQVGVPFTSVALVAGSIYNSVTLTSLASSLSDLVPRLSTSFDITQVGGVSDMYCFYTKTCHPLRFSAITVTPVNANCVKLGLYTRDTSQALMLVHSILAALPSDVCLQPLTMSDQRQRSWDENIRQQLLAKMKEAATYVMDGYEARSVSYKKVSTQTKPTTSHVSKGDTEGNVGNGDVIARGNESATFDAEDYEDWRKKLYKIQSEIDDLYIKFLE